MTKQELIKLFDNLHSEDVQGEIEGIFYGRHGEKIYTDSIRVDMDSGRIILVQKGMDYYETNKRNWEQELEFINEMERHKVSTHKLVERTKTGETRYE